MNLIRQLNKVTLNVYLPSHSCVMWCFIRQLFIIYWMLVKSAKCKHNNSKIMPAVPKNTGTWGMNTTIVNITILHMKYENSIKDSPSIVSEV